MEEKLFKKRQQKRLNVTCREKRRVKRHCSGLWSGTEVRSLANVASCFIPGIQVGVRCGLGQEENEQQRQADRCNANKFPVCL